MPLKRLGGCYKLMPCYSKKPKRANRREEDHHGHWHMKRQKTYCFKKMKYKTWCNKSGQQAEENNEHEFYFLSNNEIKMSERD